MFNLYNFDRGVSGSLKYTELRSNRSLKKRLAYFKQWVNTQIKNPAVFCHANKLKTIYLGQNVIDGYKTAFPVLLVLNIMKLNQYFR